ncbi:hypothetical protein GC170_15265 [bacterium]|nr:hypothetical protein [bacterium]
MPPDNRSPIAGKSTPARTILVEALVVGAVLVSLVATFAAVFLFIENGHRRKTSEIVKAQAPAPPAPVPVTPDPPSAVVAEVKPTRPEPPPPDNSAEIARELDARIAKAREAKAKSDLFAWTAQKAADWLKNRAKQAEAQAAGALDSGEKAAAEASRLRDHASQIADAVARLELKRDDAKSKLEAAKSRKGYSILPYRGQNGAWQRPLPIECSRDIAQIMPGGPSFRLIDLELSGLTRNSLFARIVELAIRKAAAQATPDGDAPTVYVLFVVRPSGIKAYYEARARLQAQGVAFGYELIDETTPIDYPDLGNLAEWPGYVPSDEIADALAAEPIGGSLPGTSGNGPGLAGSGGGHGQNESGLFVWREGLDGKRPGRADGGDGAPSGGPNGTAGFGPGGANMMPGTSIEPGGGVGGNSPRVDFGPGTLSQLGRSGSGRNVTGGMLPGQGVSPSTKLGSGVGGGAGGMAGGSPGAGRSSVPNLEPPWGERPDPRRPGGSVAGSSSGGGINAGQAMPDGPAGGSNAAKGNGSGTFEGLVAELAAQSDASSARSLTRPGAVAITPGDLAEEFEDRQASPFGGGGSQPREPGAASRRMAGGQPAASTGGSPFGTTPPTLPRFEPAPTANGDSKSTGANSASAGSSVANSVPATSASGSEPASDSGEGNPSGATPSNGSAGSSANRSANGSTSTNGGMPSGSAGAPSSGGSPAPDAPKFGIKNGLKRIFGGEERLPEKSWEVSLTCDAGGLTIRPGEHRLSLNDLQGDPDLLPRTLQSMFERHVRENPERYWRPYVKYRIAAGGEPLMGLSQSQLAQGFVRWPAILEPVAATNREAAR